MPRSGDLLLLSRSGYDAAGVDSAIRTVFGHFGGIGRFVRPGSRVLLKVNLVAGHPPERRVTTDPEIVRAVARQVLSAGGRPFIADSPGIDAFVPAAERAGFMDVARELGIPCVELTDPVPLPPAPDALFRRIEVSRLVLEADTVINLPKMKTHGQMLLTLGVKNLCGCIVGRRKASWHYDVGLSRERFAGLLLDLWAGIAPALTILDGIVGMDGAGPTSGRPFPYGIVAAAEDALALDFQLCRMMGASLEDFPLWLAAKKRGLPQCGPNGSTLAGDFPSSHTFPGTDIPAPRSLRLLPRLPFARLWERALTSRPVHVPSLCIGCGRCEAVCAAGALKHADRTVRFNYRRCIRCYCCHEMCPVRAIAFRESPLVRLLRGAEHLASRLTRLRGR